MAYPIPNNRPGPFGAAPGYPNSVAGALAALHARSVGMNQRYGLGNAKAAGQVRGTLTGLLTGKGGATTAKPKPLTDAELAAQQARQMYDPVIQEITRAENARAAAGMQAIQGYTGQEQRLLAGMVPQTQAEYQGATANENAINDALRQSLTGAGGTAADALGGKLQQIAADPATAARVNAEVAAVASGAANAGYATGQATTSALNQQGAAATDYSRKLPGIAGLAGVQSAKALQSQVSNDLHTQLSELAAKEPAAAQQILDGIRSAKSQQQKEQIAALIAAGKTDAALKLAQMNNRTRVSIANANNQTRASVANARNQTARDIAASGNQTRASIAAENRKAANQRAAASNDVKWYQAQTSRYRATHPKSSASDTPKLTALQIQKYRASAASIANNGKNGLPDKNLPPISPYETWQHMRESGVPTVIAIDAINRAYGTNFNPKGVLP